MAQGLAWPAWGAVESPFHALGLTISVALWGTLAGVVLGFPLALLFHRSRLIRSGCAFLRAIHEMFWALLFLQVFGLSALTALAALAIPYAGIFAKVYAEILEQTPGHPSMPCLPEQPARALRLHRVAAGLAATGRLYPLPLRMWPACQCAAGLRRPADPWIPARDGLSRRSLPRGWRPALAILSADRQLAWWSHRRLLPVLAIGGAFLLGPWPSVDGALLWRFVSQDICRGHCSNGTGRDSPAG